MRKTNTVFGMIACVGLLAVSVVACSDEKTTTTQGFDFTACMEEAGNNGLARQACRVEKEITEQEAQQLAQKTLKQERQNSLHEAEKLAATERATKLKENLLENSSKTTLNQSVSYSLEANIQEAVTSALEKLVVSFKTEMRKGGLRYRKIIKSDKGEIHIHLRNARDFNKAKNIISDKFPGFSLENDSTTVISATLRQQGLNSIKTSAVEQNMEVIRKRLQQLEIDNLNIHLEDDSKIAVSLDGVQNIERFKSLIGKHVVLEMRMVDEERNEKALSIDTAPAGSTFYSFQDGTKILLKNGVIYSSDNIIDAQSIKVKGTSEPIVEILLNPMGARINQRVTGDNIGNRMAFIYREVVSKRKQDQSNSRKNPETELDESTWTTHKTEEVIMAPMIRDQLGKRVHIHGIKSFAEASDLALILRSGTLASPVNITQYDSNRLE